MNQKTCALTGHRKLPETFDKNRLYDALEDLIGRGYTYFFCGMAQGFDLAALQCLADLKEKYRIEIEASIPYRGQENGFSSAERTVYRRLLQWCDRVTYLYEEYRDGCFLARDRYMVDGAELLFAYCVQEKGGTAYTVKYAQKKGVEVEFFRDI